MTELTLDLSRIVLPGEPGATGGTCTFRAVAYMDDGKMLTGIGEGTWETVGKHKWRIRGINYVDGRTIASDGVADFATQSLTGTIYEWN